MSRKIGLDALFLRPTPRPAHTEYSLDMNSDLLRRLTGLDPRDNNQRTECVRRFRAAADYDFLWCTHDGPIDWAARGRVTDMGHGAYEEDAADQREATACPFHDVEEVWEFDPAKEYGLPTMAESVQFYEDYYQRTQAEWPDQVVAGGYYKSVVSGAIQTFGWEMLLEAAADRQRFAEVLRRFGRYTLHFAKAWAQTSVEVYIQHDDMVWTEGPFIHPDFYRGVIFPIYRELWADLKQAGKKVLFCSDGLFTMFMHDIAAAGADGFIFEPSNDMDWVAREFGQTHVIVGSKVDCRTMAFGAWPEVKAQIDATLAVARRCPGFMVAVGNHIPPSVPTEMSMQYLTYLKANWRR